MYSTKIRYSTDKRFYLSSSPSYNVSMVVWVLGMPQLRRSRHSRQTLRHSPQSRIPTLVKGRPPVELPSLWGTRVHGESLLFMYECPGKRWAYYYNIFSFSHHLSMDGHWPSSSLSTCCMVSLRGDGALFRHATQDGLAECDLPGKNPLKYSAVSGSRTRATGRTDSELLHWAIMTASIHVYRNIFYRLSGLEILNTIRYSGLLLMREGRWSSDNRGVLTTVEWSWP